MAITEAFAGSQTILTADTEHSLVTDTAGPDVETSDGIFQVFIDVSDMIAGDEIAIKIYEKVQAADTQRVVYQSNLVGPQSPPIWVSPSLILLHGWDCTVDVVAGTNVAITWSIRKVA